MLNIFDPLPSLFFDGALRVASLGEGGQFGIIKYSTVAMMRSLMVNFSGYLIDTFRMAVLAPGMSSQIDHASPAPGWSIQTVVFRIGFLPLTLMPSTIPALFFKVGASWIFAWSLGSYGHRIIAFLAWSCLPQFAAYPEWPRSWQYDVERQRLPSSEYDYSSY